MSEYKLTFLYKQGLDYKTRNFILLTVILAITVVSSIVIHQRLRTTYVELRKESAHLESELSDLESEIDRAGPLQEELERLQEELYLTDKVIADFNNPTSTLAYIFSIFDRYRNSLNFDFRVERTGNVRNSEGVHYNRYTVNGNDYLNNVFIFIDQLERQPHLFTIEDIDITSQPAEEKGKVGYTIGFNGYYADTGEPPSQVEIRNLTRNTLPYNIFYPRIHQPVIDEPDMDLPEVENLIIIAMTSDRIYVRDTARQTVDNMETGDKVRYGELSSIDWENQQAVFTVNRTGLRETVKLKFSR